MKAIPHETKTAHAPYIDTHLIRVGLVWVERQADVALIEALRQITGRKA